MACFGRRSCDRDDYDCNVHMNVVSGANDTEEEACGCGCCGCCCCGCGCNTGCSAVGGTTGGNCGPCHYVTNAQCDCEEAEETTCNCNGCSMCD